MNAFITTKRSHKVGILPEQECLAKTLSVYTDNKISYQKGCDTYTHLWVTCRVIQVLAELWSEFPIGKLILPEAQWLAALHDIGKVTPAFLYKIYMKLGEMLPWPSEIKEADGGHARSSEIILEAMYGSDFSRLAANHHGGAFWRLDPGDFLGNELLGGKEWQNLRIQIISHLKESLHLPSCDLKKIPQEKFDLILGATILADWISSSMDIPYSSPLPSTEQIYFAIKNTGFHPISWKQHLSFRDIFGFHPNLLQNTCQQITTPGNIYIIESGMGSGKTEAALSMAYQLLQKKQANGIYFSMPTKLTSEKIFDRMNDFLIRCTDEVSTKTLLIHGDSWLDWNLAETDADGTCINAGQWFQTKKRALLAPFAAGTVDQILMAVVNVKHRALRSFALTGKVVVFDEVHTYDSYTGTLITLLIQKIREQGGTVIVLSATLTANAKAALLGIPEKNYSPSTAYPLVSFKTHSSDLIHEVPIPTNQQADVSIKNVFTNQDAFVEACRRASKGEQVLWIENTVDQAQKTFSILKTCTGIEIGLIHSRFPLLIRNEKENYWVRTLGKNGADERRLRGRILVATQILEQSVDVDADFLVTRLAPIDMLLQRIGRLWRHPMLNALRPKTAARETWVLIPESYNTPEKYINDSSAFLPYDSYWMYRTYQVWKNLSFLSIPKDIRPLLETIYMDQNETGLLLQMKLKMSERRVQLEKQAFIAQGSANKILSDESVTTRCSDIETVQILLLHKGNHGFSLQEKLAVLFSDMPVVLPMKSADKSEKIAIVRQLQQYMIQIPVYMAPEYEDFPTDFLEDLFWIGDNESRPIRAAYVDDSGMLLTMSGLPIKGKYELFYHEHLGCRSIKKEVVNVL